MRLTRLGKLVVLIGVLSIISVGCALGYSIEKKAVAPPKTVVITEVKKEPMTEKKIIDNNIFIKTSKAKIYQQAVRDSKVIVVAIKGAAVKKLEELVDPVTKITWYKVLYKNESGSVEGWIEADNTVKKWSQTLPQRFQNLDYTPQQKLKEYPNNPRVEVHGIYVTINSASSTYIDKLIELSKRTEINTFVIDVKDDNGYMLFSTIAAQRYCPDANKRARVKDIAALMKKLKDNNIYTIARIVSFKDPTYTKRNPDKAIVYKSTGKPYMNNDGLIWASAYDKNLWKYNIDVSKEAAAVGFNEIQFDYVRFPASNGGRLDNMLDYRNTNGETKPQAIQNYLKYAREQLAPLGVYISADIYGLVGSVEDDMSLGQYWEAVSNIVDYVSPMMYPSHYANGTYGLKIPDAFPYQTINRCTEDAIIRNKNIETPAYIRPWIQDFTATWVKGHIKYSAKQLEEQIKALNDNNVHEYLLWNAGNVYSEAAVAKKVD